MTNVYEQISPEPPLAGDETAMLLGFLERQRATFAWKCGGLDTAGLQATLGPSSMTLGGMLKHLARFEDDMSSEWLHGRGQLSPWDTVDWTADPDWEWSSAAEGSPGQLQTLWRDAVARSRSLLSEALADAANHHPDVDLRYEGVTVRLKTHDIDGLSELDVTLARQISAARELGVSADPSTVQTVQITIDALAGPDARPFWRAVLGYQEVGDQDLVDPHGRGPSFWFQRMDAPRPQRNRIHVDISVRTTGPRRGSRRRSPPAATW
jgi:hypothetical protein